MIDPRVKTFRDQFHGHVKMLDFWADKIRKEEDREDIACNIMMWLKAVIPLIDEGYKKIEGLRGTDEIKDDVEHYLLKLREFLVSLESSEENA